MDWLKSSTAFSCSTMDSPMPRAAGRPGLLSFISCHRMLVAELRAQPFPAFEHLPQMFHCMPDIFEADVERGQAEPQDVLLPCAIPGAVIADHAAGDQRLHDRIGAGT